jgi:ABC-2 type transport system ATP-binding protein
MTSGAASLAVDVQGLNKSFGDKHVVNDVAIQVGTGRVTGFLGPNGSGKTTCLRMLCGLLTPDSGEGSVLGYDFRSQAREIKLRTGYMTQKFSLYDDLTIADSWRPGCRGDGNSGWRWPPLSCTSRNCCCWTSQPPGWTPRRDANSGTRSTAWPPMA